MWEIIGYIKLKLSHISGLGLYIKKIENEQIKAK